MKADSRRPTIKPMSLACRQVYPNIGSRRPNDKLEPKLVFSLELLYKRGSSDTGWVESVVRLYEARSECLVQHKLKPMSRKAYLHAHSLSACSCVV